LEIIFWIEIIFGIDPIIQIKIIFFAGKAKKYVKYGKIC
jgi:hypothetical protein